MNHLNQLSVVIAGASLAGLMSGIVLSRKGFQVTILERSGSNRPTGAVLQVDHGGLDSNPEARFLRKIASAGMQKADAWEDIEKRLRKYVENTPNINLKFNTRIVEAGQDDSNAWLITDNGVRVTGNLVIGADGYRSQVRKTVAPDHPNATYTGYLIWVALLSEKEISPKNRFGKDAPILSIHDKCGDLLLGSMLTGSDGETTPGHRRIGFGWYDNTVNGLLEKLGCIKGSIVNHSLYTKDLSKEYLATLRSRAQERWPQPWREAAVHGIDTQRLVGVPVAEYVPERLVRGRIALVGDAAHLSTPMSANGFNAALDDAVSLASCFDAHTNNSLVDSALQNYERKRLQTVQEIVNSGRSFSRSFGRL